MNGPKIADFLDRGARDGVFPGGVLLVADRGEIVLEHAAGLRAVAPTPGPIVDLGTSYDIASLTKVVTTTLVLRLVEAGLVALDTPACAYVPELLGGPKNRIRVGDLLSHSAGLAAWRPFFARLRAGDWANASNPRDGLLRMACEEELEAEPGARAIYSDLGFIILGVLVERAANEQLDALAHRAVFEPLGMERTRFVTLPKARPFPEAAPTEQCAYRGLVHGEVHDENCHAAGGIAGHAGLFSTAADLSKLCSAWVLAWRGEQHAGGLPCTLARAFLAPSPISDSTWRFGWDSPSRSPATSQAGDLWPRDGVGHLGFTGCSMWLDPSRGRWVVLLTNRVHPVRENQRIKQFRPALHDLIVREL